MIKNLKIKKFRNIENQEIELGKVITFISGQNGVGKSTILGLLGQSFSFYGTKWSKGASDEEKKAINSDEYLDIYGNQFETDFSDIFRLSNKYDHPDFDKESNEISQTTPLLNQYYYSLYFHEGKLTEDSVSCYIKDRGKDDQTIRVVPSKIGTKTPVKYSNFTCPVAYLGMDRVFPIVKLGTENLKINETDLTETEKQFFNDQKNYISLLNEEYEQQQLSSLKIKKTIVNTNHYDYQGMSIGQDNISKIISIIISFERLKKKMKSKYKGGILLIDEIESTLFPAAQFNLFKFLYNNCKRLKIQVIATTHSTELLKYLSVNKADYEFGNHSKIIYLIKRNNKIQIKNDYDYRNIAMDLTLIQKNKAIKKPIIYFEDKEAVLIFKKIVGNKIFKCFEIPNVTLGSGNYITLYEHNFEQIINSLVVLDGDANDEKKYERIGEIPNNFLFLPGDTPENLVYYYLNSLSDNHKFWTDTYTQQMFINNYREKVEHKLKNETKRVLMKDWFNSEKSNWGSREISRFYKFWKIDNKEIIDNFIINLRDSTENLLEKIQSEIKIDW